jgi:hypothetical protein
VGKVSSLPTLTFTLKIGLLICLTWICGIIYPIPIVFTNQITYHVNDQICQIPLLFSFLLIFHACYLYLIPVGYIMLIYFKMIRYVQEMSKRVTSANTLSRAQRELRMVNRIVLVVSIIFGWVDEGEGVFLTLTHPRPHPPTPTHTHPPIIVHQITIRY